MTTWILTPPHPALTTRVVPRKAPLASLGILVLTSQLAPGHRLHRCQRLGLIARCPEGLLGLVPRRWLHCYRYRRGLQRHWHCRCRRPLWHWCRQDLDYPHQRCRCHPRCWRCRCWWSYRRPCPLGPKALSTQLKCASAQLNHSLPLPLHTSRTLQDYYSAIDLCTLLSFFLVPGSIWSHGVVSCVN
jgi:hypothetical protein